MTIDLYKCTDDTRVLQKTFTDLTEIENVSILGSASVLEPILLLQYSAAYLAYQYCYIPDFGRTYYIRDRVVNTAGQLLLYLQIDALSSYSEELLGCSAQAIRSESKGSTHVPDAQYPVDPSREYVTSKLFSSGDLDPPAVLPDNPRRYILTLK